MKSGARCATRTRRDYDGLELSIQTSTRDLSVPSTVFDRQP